MMQALLSGTVTWFLERAILLVLVIIGLSYLWPYVKAFFTSALSKVAGSSASTSVTSLIDNAVVKVDEYQARVALQTAAMLFEKHGSPEIGASLRSFVVTAVGWSNTPETTTKV